MRKIIFLVFFLLFSCDGTSLFSGSEFTGSKGLNFYFDYDAPPGYVYEESSFPVRVFVENVGAFDVKNAVYSLGVEEQYVNAEDKNGQLSLKGKSLERPYGEQKQLLISSKAKSVGSQEGITTLLSFNLCYPYNTKASSTTCIDASPTSKSKKVCSVGAQYFNAGQAAPIGITNVVPRMIIEEQGVKPQYVITIKNLDDGSIIGSDYVNYYCLGKNIPREHHNVIEVEVFLNKEKLICNKTKLNLKEGSDDIFCELQRVIPSVEGSFTSPLVVDLKYGYAQTITKKVRIQSKN